jgi:hypothetical protein
LSTETGSPLAVETQSDEQQRNELWELIKEAAKRYEELDIAGKVRLLQFIQKDVQLERGALRKQLASRDRPRKRSL